MSEKTTIHNFKERFLAKIRKTDGCWLWTGAKKVEGYGMFRYPGMKTNQAAHRVSWIIHNGPIKNGLCVLHRCDNPPCVRPDHLWLGTSMENTADRIKKGRSIWVRGEDHGVSVLTESQVLEIKRTYQYRGAINSGTLSRKFNCSDMAILRIVKGETWGHVAAESVDCGEGR